MNTYYKLSIEKTARPMGNNMDWQLYDNQTKEFKTLDGLKNYLKNEYYYVKKIVKSYIDDENGNPKQSGYIYCFKTDPVSYDDCKHFEQHWISIYKIKSESILL